MKTTGRAGSQIQARFRTFGEKATKSVQAIARKANLLIALTLAAGFVLTIVLFMQTREGVFFLSDGGLRFLMTEQYAKGKLSIYLLEEHPAWVHRAWESGVDPFEPPTVYMQDGKHIVAFSMWFPLITAPFYTLFGFRGLYIIPTLSLWFLWIRLLVLGKRLKVNNLILWLGLVAFSLGSPMVVYGALFWEHTLTVLLVFFSIEFVLCAREHHYSLPAAVFMGFLSGLSTWFRYEAFLVIVPVMYYLYVRSWRKVKKSEAAFIFSAAAAIGLLFLINWKLYGSPLSMQFENISGTFGNSARYWFAYLVFLMLQKRLFYYYPLVIFGLTAYPLLLFNKPKLDTLFLLAMPLLIVFVTPLMLVDAGGKHWGVRYFYVMFPALIVVIMLALEVVRRQPAHWLRWGLSMLFAASLLLSTFHNSVTGSIHISEDYAGRVRPSLAYLRSSPIQDIAVGHRVMAEELAFLYHSRNFFTVLNDDEMSTLGQALAEQGIDQFIFLTTPQYYVPPGELDATDIGRHPLRLTFTSKPLAGAYTLYIGQIRFR
jgi:hypothetical protein